VVLGEMHELPGSPGPVYRMIGERIAGIASQVVFVGGKTGFQMYRSGALRTTVDGQTMSEYASRDPLAAVAIMRGKMLPGDVVLIKGRETQRFERIALALAGRTVDCNIPTCDARVRCERCPMLERDWKESELAM